MAKERMEDWEMTLQERYEHDVESSKFKADLVGILSEIMVSLREQTELTEKTLEFLKDQVERAEAINELGKKVKELGRLMTDE